MKRINSKVVSGFVLLTIGLTLLTAQNLTTDTYEDLLILFKEWRSFEKPPFINGAPDYTASTFSERYESFKKFKERLNNIDNTNWSTEQQIDWYLLFAELNGFDFNHRILKPWVRDPAFYKSLFMERSDVPAHEGPTHHAVTELWMYKFPLSKNDEKKLISDLKVIPPLNNQAQKNLTGNARELWITGIRSIKDQSKNLQELKNSVGSKADHELLNAISEAKTASDELVIWLEQQAASKTGPSGIGKENYSWYQQNVHLVPLSWEDEVMILKRELARAWSSLKLEEQRNRNLPPLVAAASPEEYQKLADQSAEKLIQFLREQQIVTVEDYFQPALNEHKGSFYPEQQRNFFLIGAHYNPTPLYSHFYHWFELAAMDKQPHKSELRRYPFLYNIFDSRNEGVATAVEEMFMQAGLYDDNPRVKEIVYIMIAQRAARGLGSLYAHANQMTMKEASTIHAEWTPRNWVKTGGDLLIFEQHLYLRQPGYGTSYITGKYLLDGIIAEYARQKEVQNEPFKLRDFMDTLNATGSIPIALAHWQITGLKDPVEMILKGNNH